MEGMSVPIKPYFSLGILAIVFLASACTSETKNETPVPEKKPIVKAATPSICYSLVNTFQHDSTCYTQGFLFYKGQATGNDLIHLQALSKDDNSKILRSLSMLFVYLFNFIVV